MKLYHALVAILLTSILPVNAARSLKIKNTAPFKITASLSLGSPCEWTQEEIAQGKEFQVDIANCNLLQVSVTGPNVQAQSPATPSNNAFGKNGDIRLEVLYTTNPNALKIERR